MVEAGQVVVALVTAVLYVILCAYAYAEWITGRRSSKTSRIFTLIILVAAVAIITVIYCVIMLITLSHVLALLFFALLVTLAVYRVRSFMPRVRDCRGPFSMGDVEYYVCSCDDVNAWYDPRSRRIFVSELLVNALGERELRAVLLHEKGHYESRLLSSASTFLAALWILIMAGILVIPLVIIASMVLAWLMGFNYSIGIEGFMVMVMLYSLGCVATSLVFSLSWIAEHRADERALSEGLGEALVRALVKMSLMRSAVRAKKELCAEIHLSLRGARIEIDGRGLSASITRWRAFKEFVKAVIVSVPLSAVEFLKRPMYITHPPDSLRAYYVLTLT